MTLLPDFASHKRQRFQPVLIDSSWFILDRKQGRRAGMLRFRVEIQARWAAEMLNAAYLEGLEVGRAQS